MTVLECSGKIESRRQRRDERGAEGAMATGSHRIFIWRWAFDPNISIERQLLAGQGFHSMSFIVVGAGLCTSLHVSARHCKEVTTDVTIPLQAFNCKEVHENIVKIYKSLLKAVNNVSSGGFLLLLKTIKMIRNIA